MTTYIEGRTPDFELVKFAIVSREGMILRTQLGLTGVQIGEIVRSPDGSEWLVESLPGPNVRGVLGVTVTQHKGEFVRTPEKGPIDFPPPPAETQEQIQESWAKAKNFPVAIASKRDPL